MNSMADQINDLITIPDILQKYGYGLGRSRRIPCMLHGGKENNFGYTDKVFHCFVCHAKGNVIHLVEQIFNIDFGQAIIRINSDFGLGLTSEKPSFRQQKKLRQILHRRDQEKRYKLELKADYLEVTKEYQFLQKAISKFAPLDSNQPSDSWHPFFIYAAQNVGIIENWLNENINRLEV